MKLENLSHAPALTFSVVVFGAAVVVLLVVFTVVVCAAVDCAETSAKTDTNTAQKPITKPRRKLCILVKETAPVSIVYNSVKRRHKIKCRTLP